MRRAILAGIFSPEIKFPRSLLSINKVLYATARVILLSRLLTFFPSDVSSVSASPLLLVCALVQASRTQLIIKGRNKFFISLLCKSCALCGRGKFYTSPQLQAFIFNSYISRCELVNCIAVCGTLRLLITHSFQNSFYQ